MEMALTRFPTLAFLTIQFYNQATGKPLVTSQARAKCRVN